MKKQFFLAILCLTIVLAFISCSRTDAAKKVDVLISVIGDVTLESKNDIEKAEIAYNGLSKEEQKQVWKYKKLKKARDKYNILLRKDKSERLEKLLGLIGTVELNDESNIKSARNLYNTFDEEGKSSFEHYQDLLDAESKLKSLKIMQVEKIINKIGEVSSTSGIAIKEAFYQYNKLSYEEKSNVTNSDALINAKETYKKIVEGNKGKLRKNVDRPRNLIFYESTAEPGTVYANYVLPYIFCSDGAEGLRIRWWYSGFQWINTYEVVVIVDGVRREISYNERFTRDSNWSGYYWEYIDLVASKNDFDILNMMANGKNVEVAFVGTRGSYEFTLSNVYKREIRKVLDAFDMTNSINEF